MGSPPRARIRAWFLTCLAGFLTCLLLTMGLSILRRRAIAPSQAVFYTPLSGEAEWMGDWELSQRGADPSQAGSQTGADRVIIPFTGTSLALRVRRGDYRGYLFVTIDGAPANRLPREERGGYIVLTSPQRTPQIVTIPVAGGLTQGPHVAQVTAERGWDQWPLVGWRVGDASRGLAYRWAQVGSTTVGLACMAGAVWLGRRAVGINGASEAAGLFRRPESGEIAEQHLPRISTPLGLGIMFVTVGALYFSPWSALKIVAGLALVGCILLRLDLGLALVALCIPFYLRPWSLAGKSFSLVETATLGCVASWCVRVLRRWWRGGYERRWDWRQGLRRIARAVSPLDLAVLGFVGVAGASFFVAQYRHVALRELRVLILEPALFYLLLRTTRLDGRAVWRLVDFFVAGALLIALLGLVQYGFNDLDWVRRALGDVIRAEGGFHRLRSIYGSPNSVGLYLGRALPILVAVALWGANRRRRIAYGLAVLPVGLAVLLSFSKGALLLGVPLSLLALGVLAGGWWFWASVLAVIMGGVAAIPLLATPRFASIFDPSQGTFFLRRQLWRSSWRMFVAHPILGVGPDNFLYHYRSRYILPAAWQEPGLSQAHNVLLDYATRMGLFGLAMGVWLQVAFWNQALGLRRLSDRDRRALALGLMGAMVNVLAHGVVDASYFLIDLAFAFFLILGVVQWLKGAKEEV